MYERMVLDPLRGASEKIGTIQRRLAWPLRKDDTHTSRMYHFFPGTCSGVSIREQVLQGDALGYTPGWGRRAITKTRALVGSCSIAPTGV